jgi:hypothetical protein
VSCDEEAVIAVDAVSSCTATHLGALQEMEWFVHGCACE